MSISPAITWKDAPTRSVKVGGIKFAYRELGPDSGVPVIFLNHLAAELDRWDPRVVDGIAAKRRVIVFDNRGIGASTGTTPRSVAAMARDATGTANGRRAAREFLKRLNERTDNRDKPVSIGAFLAQLKAIHAWGRQATADLSAIRQPVLVANGGADKMVASSNSVDLARRLPNAELILYDDAGHGGIFQYHDEFTEAAIKFLSIH